jgi:hypothetical protein
MAFPLGNLPTQGEKNALAGSTGSPNTGNEYITKVERAAVNGVATLNGSARVTQRLSYEAATGGVATLDGSSKVVQRSAAEGISNGVATLDASGRVPIAQLFMAPTSPVQVIGFTASGLYGAWICNTTSSFTAELPAANSVPNGLILYFINTGPNTLNITVGGGDTLVANSSSIPGSANNSAAFVSNGVSIWYQLCKV